MWFGILFSALQNEAQAMVCFGEPFEYGIENLMAHWEDMNLWCKVKIVQ